MRTRRIAHPARRRSVSATRRSGDAARAQRCRPHDHVESDLGLVGRRTGFDPDQRRGNDSNATHRIAQLGIGYCPEERGIFASLSCEENLMLPPRWSRAGMSVDDIYSCFRICGTPHQYRHAPVGGEQQMLGRWRAYCGPRATLLLLDEISEGWRR